MHLFSGSPAAPAVPVNLTECLSASVKPVRTGRNIFFVHAAFEGTYEQQHDPKTRQALACRCGLFSFDGFVVRLNILCVQFAGTWPAVFAIAARLDYGPAGE